MIAEAGTMANRLQPSPSVSRPTIAIRMLSPRLNSAIITMSIR